MLALLYKPSSPHLRPLNFFSVTMGDSPVLLAKAKSFTCIPGFVCLHLHKDAAPEIFVCFSCCNFLSLDYITL